MTSTGSKVLPTPGMKVLCVAEYRDIPAGRIGRFIGRWVVDDGVKYRINELGEWYCEIHSKMFGQYFITEEHPDYETLCELYRL